MSAAERTGAAPAGARAERRQPVYARTATVHGDPKAVDDGVAFLRDRVMPAVEGLPGYVGLSMLADRDSGRCIATTSWADEAAMSSTGEQLRPLRARFAQILGGPPELQSWEIAVLHRVHEAPDGACTRVTWMRTDPLHSVDCSCPSATTSSTGTRTQTPIRTRWARMMRWKISWSVI